MHWASKAGGPPPVPVDLPPVPPPEADELEPVPPCPPVPVELAVLEDDELVVEPEVDAEDDEVVVPVVPVEVRSGSGVRPQAARASAPANQSVVVFMIV